MAAKKRIERLTPDQEARLPVVRREWFEVGTCTEPADRPRAEAAITQMYAVIGEPAPRFLWCDSPLTANLANLLGPQKDSLWASLWASLRDSLGASLRDSLEASLRASLGASLGVSLRASLRDSLVASLGVSLEASLRASLGDGLGVSLWASLRDSLGASLRDSLEASLGDGLETTFLGQQDAYWIAFYLFAAEIGVPYKPEAAERLGWHAEIARSCMWWWPHRGVCVVSERPSVCKLDAAGRIHADGGPAVAFRDGWSVWALNGVRVPQWLAETPAERIDPRWLRELDNAQVRAEFARKVGIERVLHALSAGPIDVQGEYELHLLDFGDGRQARPYLKMHNPSVPELWHVEGVPPGTRSVREALHARKPAEMRAIPVSEDGEAWYQQGDVCVWPRGARALRPYPEVLT
jgi:hypothetical protein